MIVQATNTGSDVAATQFDLAVRQIFLMRFFDISFLYEEYWADDA